VRDTTERSKFGRPLLAAALLTIVAAAAVASARAETKSPRHEPQLDATVRYLQESQNMDGGFGAETGAASDPITSAWVALSLAAADINPRSQAKAGGASVYEYLTAQVGRLDVTTDFERELMVVNATEYPPQPLGGVNLVEKLLARQLPNGGFPHQEGGPTAGMNDTIYAIIALSPIKEPTVEAAVARAAEFVLAQQNADHSWPSTCPKSVPGCAPSGVDPEGEIDMTGAAIEALNAAGLHGTEAQAGALEYLREAQLPDGGFPEKTRETESNVASTCWAVQGIWAAGENPETWRTGSGLATEEPLDYISSLQQPEGKIRYRAREEMNGLWMTSYCSPALAGRALPIVPPPAYTPPPPAEPTGGEASTGQTEGGVKAGGGGHHAPFFSRPKNKSKGKTPGGARQTHAEKDPKNPPRDHSRDRRGANHHQPTGTETAEPMSRAEVDPEVESVSPGTAPSSSAATGAGGGGGNGGRHRGRGPTERGAPLPVKGAPRAGATTTGEEVDGIVIGSPEGTTGKLAFGAPGLKSAKIGSGDQTWPAIAIGVAAALAALAGAGLERRRSSGVAA
jgi:prenyltransferase beta subunit